VIVSLSREDKYIPEWRGNRDLPEEEQIVFHFRYLNLEEREKYIKIVPVKKVVDGKEEDTLDFEFDKKAIFKTMTTKIINLEIMEGDKSTKLETGRAMLSSGGHLIGLFDEVVSHYIITSLKGDVKN